MGIIRAPRPEANFYLLDKGISEDARLSWAARGLLVFLLGKPDHWEISVAHLRSETAKSSKPTGRDGVYALLQELISAGYVRRQQDRSESGVLGEINYLVSETPVPKEPLPASPETAQPYPANPTLVSIDTKQGLKKPERTEGSLSKTELAEGFDQFYKLYPRRQKRTAAEQAWRKLSPSSEQQVVILKALAEHCKQVDWLKDGGQYIPLPASWLNARRWEDELLPSAGSVASKNSAYHGLPNHTPGMYPEVPRGQANF